MPMGPLKMSHYRLTCPGTDAKGYLVHIWDIGSFDTCSMRGSWSSLQEKSDLKLTHCFCGSYLILYIPLVIHLIIFHFYAFLLNRILTSDKANRWNAAAACCASFNTVEVWSAQRKSRAVHDTVAHFSHIFNKTTFDLMFYECEEENQDLNKCCICCLWSGKHRLNLLRLLLWLRRRLCLLCFHRAVDVFCKQKHVCMLCALFAPWAAALNMCGSCGGSCIMDMMETKTAVTSCVSWFTQLLGALAVCWLYYVPACTSYSADLFMFAVFQSKSPTLGSCTKHCIVFKSESEQTDQSPTLQQK